MAKEDTLVGQWMVWRAVERHRGQVHGQDEAVGERVNEARVNDLE